MRCVRPSIRSDTPAHRRVRDDGVQELREGPLREPGRLGETGPGGEHGAVRADGVPSRGAAAEELGPGQSNTLNTP